MEFIPKLFAKNELIVAFLVVGLIMLVSVFISQKLLRNKIPGAAVAITLGLVLAYFGGKKGIADFPLFAGMAFLGGSMMRDFSIVSTAMGASLSEIKKTGWVGVLSLFIGIAVAFFIGGSMGYFMGYTDIKSVATIGAGACTFIVGPVTGAALGASSDIIAITPLIAKRIGLNNPQTAMIYGGLIGTTSGVAAGLAATDPKLVPYGALTATFYTGLACLLCPSVYYLILSLFI
jgi:malonate transporter MadM subunit